jgi:hypothetical protein
LQQDHPSMVKLRPEACVQNLRLSDTGTAAHP